MLDFVPVTYRSLVLSLALGAGLSACRGGVSTAAAPAMPSSVTASPPGALTDANIAAIVLAGDNADILYGSLALGKSANDAVRKFAQTTVNDHRAVNQAATDLAARLSVTPVDNTVSFDMRDNAEDKRDLLRELSGNAFDKAYIDNEVTYHIKMLGIIDNTLLPGVRNADLKALITAVRPAVAAHLEHARSLQSSMAR